VGSVPASPSFSPAASTGTGAARVARLMLQDLLSHLWKPLGRSEARSVTVVLNAGVARQPPRSDPGGPA
jgi:carbon starvation protein CstA